MGRMSDLLIELEEIAAAVPAGEFKKTYPYADIRIWESVNGRDMNEDDRQRVKHREFAKNKERF